MKCINQRFIVNSKKMAFFTYIVLFLSIIPHQMIFGAKIETLNSKQSRIPTILNSKLKKSGAATAIVALIAVTLDQVAQRSQQYTSLLDGNPTHQSFVKRFTLYWQLAQTKFGKPRSSSSNAGLHNNPTEKETVSAQDEKPANSLMCNTCGQPSRDAEKCRQCRSKSRLGKIKLPRTRQFSRTSSSESLEEDEKDKTVDSGEQTCVYCGNFSRGKLYCGNLECESSAQALRTPRSFSSNTGNISGALEPDSDRIPPYL